MSYHGYCVEDIIDDEFDLYDPSYSPEDEAWAQIEGFPGYYISDGGHVWGPGRHGHGDYMRPAPVGSMGHLDICLVDAFGRRQHRYVHRLVAEAFIPNPNHYPVVRHLDDDVTNNNVCNLAWGTNADNMHDCIEHGRFRYFTPEDIRKANEVRMKPVKMVHVRTGETLIFESQNEASRATGIDQQTICNAYNGKIRTAKGYICCDPNENKTADTYQQKLARLIAVNEFNGDCVEAIGQTAMAEELGVSTASVSMCLSGKMRSVKGWVIDYAD